MFDAVLNRGNVPQGRFGIGASVSVLFHSSLIALALWLSPGPFGSNDEKEVAVQFMKPALPAPPPPPPPPLRKHSLSTPQTQHVKRKPARNPVTIRQPKEIPRQIPEEGESLGSKEKDEGGVSDAVESGVAGGVEDGGVPGGTVGGVVGGVLGGQLGVELEAREPSIHEGMTPPQQTSGEPPRYTREALDAHIQGTMLLKCVITVQGRLEKCKIIKPLPLMDQAVLDAVATWRYRPVYYRGRPIAVEYVIPIKVVIPHEN